MTEESKEDELTSKKLLVDNSSDFQFHAAYLAYSDIFDKTTDSEIKKQLNLNISALQKNEISYSTFYEIIGQYRQEVRSRHQYGRALIKTQKKREWRRKAQKRERNKRHKK